MIYNCTVKEGVDWIKMIDSLPDGIAVKKSLRNIGILQVECENNFELKKISSFLEIEENKEKRTSKD